MRILGAEVLVVFSGAHAIDCAVAFQPRMVVLDINMPGLDGFETAKQLKLQLWAKDALFVAHTGMRREPRMTEEFNGFHHILTKGDASESLERIVAKLLRA